MRPIDLASEHGLSTQAIRNYEDAGILPSAARTRHGYRVYTPKHAEALRAFLALLPGHGHQGATAIMRAVNDGSVAETVRLIDEGHAQLAEDRRTLEAVENALRDLECGASHGCSGRADHVAPAGPAELSIGPLARRLGVRPATLRKWERADVMHPRRDPLTGYRVYDEADIRDAQLAHQLRRGGYLLSRIAPLIAQVRTAGGLEPLEATLGDWRDRITARGRSMLTGAAALEAYLRALSAGPEGR